VPLVCIGLSHKTAPVEVREQHAFPASRMAEALVALCDYEMVREAAMLSTCGRLEIYAEVEAYEAGVEQITAFLQNFRHGDIADLSSYVYTLLGTQAIEHLFRVATGLDSMLIGEAEILGQVKDAYIQAQRADSLGTTLHALFREALAAGKAARSQTAIGDDSVSVATAAVEYAKQQFGGSLAGKTVLVIGAGKMGATAAKRLRLEGCKRLLVANRSRHRAQHAAGARADDAVDMPALGAALERADIVVASTGAPHFVVTPGSLGAALPARAGRPLLLVDIAVPRDVDPECAALPGVILTDIDALKGFVDVTLERRRESVPLVEEIIAEHAQRFAHWYQARATVPVVSSLVQKAEALRAAEIERLFARCPALSERERMLITGASLTIISKLLHSVVTKLRERATSDRSEALTLAHVLDDLFELSARAEETASLQ
jgi:glutamyl-tRNA reductase